jgi:hypothetical protein
LGGHAVGHISRLPEPLFDLVQSGSESFEACVSILIGKVRAKVPFQALDKGTKFVPP